MILIILSFYGLGLLLAFTPCILPMVPVLSGIIVGHGKNISTRKAFLLSFSYVLAMSVTYALIGIIFASLGSNLQTALQTPWAIILFAGLFVLLALSMFGFYDLKLPQSLQSKLANTSRKQKQGAYLGAAAMGALSTLILSPCISAPLVGVLTYIACTGKLALGGLALFFLGLGMGTPLLLIGMSAGKLLPKAGPWMNQVKGFFGVLMLGVAIYLLGRIIHAYIYLFLWAVLLITYAIFLGALSYSETNTQKLSQGIGLCFLVYGVILIVGASMGNELIFTPLKGQPNYQVQASNRPQIVANLSQIKKIIKNSEKPVFLDFYADWCTSCKFMESTVFQNQAILNKLKQVVWLKVDVTANDKDAKKVMNYFNVIAPPTFIFIDSQGQEETSLRVTGEKNAKEILTLLKNIS